jgi:hypothetical protein
MPTYFAKICIQCFHPYQVVSRRKTQQFCSATCYKVNQQQKAKTTKLASCLNCHITLTKKTSYKFCNQSCAARYNNNKRDTDVRVKQRASLKTTLATRGQARTQEKDIYKAACAFKFKIYDYPEISGYQMLVEKGIWNSMTNKDGVVRDHIISKEFGWRNQISPEIISHPANCQFISHIDNTKKGANCDLRLEDLLIRIKIWEATHSLPPLTFTRTSMSVIAVKKLTPKPNKEIYKWKLQNKSTLEIVELTNIVVWLKARGYNTTDVYGPKPKWNILEKINIRTQKRLI